MHADRIGLDAGDAAVDGLHHPLAHQTHHAARHGLRIVQHRPRLPARYQGTLRRIGPVGKRLGHHGQPLGACPAHQRRSRQCHEHQRRIGCPNRRDHVPCLPLVVCNGVVERAVRLDVAHRRACGTGEPLQRPDLVDHVGHQIGTGHVHVAPPEPRQIAVADMRPHRHPACRRRTQRGQNARRIAGMEATGHIGTGDDVEHRGIISHLPGAQALAQVAVQIDHGHLALLAHIDRNRKIGPMDCSAIHQVSTQASVPSASSAREYG